LTIVRGRFARIISVGDAIMKMIAWAQTNHHIAQTSATVMHAAPLLSEHEKLVKSTQTWVATTFFGTLLRQMRESPFHSDLLDGGKGGQAFTTMFDQQLAERMARGTGTKLVNAIVRKIEAKRAYAKQGKPGDKPGTGTDHEGADRAGGLDASGTDASRKGAVKSAANRASGTNAASTPGADARAAGTRGDAVEARDEDRQDADIRAGLSGRASISAAMSAGRLNVTPAY
jgi:Rod binding domain-containing protein